MLKKYFTFIIFAVVLLSSLNFRSSALSVSALSSVLYEPQSGRVLYEKDSHTPRPMASTTKIMTALLALEIFPPDRIITVSDAAVRVEGSALGLRGGDQITALDLVTGLLLESGNDAANAIAYAASGGIPEFAELMNKRAAKIGMKDTVFVTPSGLDKDNHSSSAFDMALLAAEALKNKTFASICSKKSTTINFGNPPRKVYVSNHNSLLKLYPFAIGVKTGFTKKSGRCLVSAAEKDGVRLIAVTLKAGDDWKDHIAMYDYGFSQVVPVQMPEPELEPVTVTGGVAASVLPVLETAPPVCTMFNDETGKLRVETSLPRFLLAPVSKGDVIGSVTYKAGSRELCTIKLKASADVEAKPVAGTLKHTARNFLSLLIEFLKL